MKIFRTVNKTVQFITLKILLVLKLNTATTSLTITIIFLNIYLVISGYLLTLNLRPFVWSIPMCHHTEAALS